MLGYILKLVRTHRGLSLMDLRLKTGLSKSSLSNIENDKNNPTIDTLEKICMALTISSADLIELVNEFEQANETQFFEMEDKLNVYINNLCSGISVSNNKKNTKKEFTTAEEAMQFILKQPVIMGYGGFDLNNLTTEDKIAFANDLLEQIEFLGYKYTKKNKNK